MQFIHSVLTFNEILTVSLLSWFVAQVLKTIINFVLLGRFQLERMWGDGGMPSALHIFLKDKHFFFSPSPWSKYDMGQTPEGLPHIAKETLRSAREKANKSYTPLVKAHSLRYRSDCSRPTRRTCSPCRRRPADRQPFISQSSRRV